MNMNIKKVLIGDYSVVDVIVSIAVGLVMIVFALIAAFVSTKMWDAMGVSYLNMPENAPTVAIFIELLCKFVSIVQLFKMLTNAAVYALAFIDHNKEDVKRAFKMMSFNIIVLAAVNVSGGVAMLHIENIFAVGVNLVLSILALCISYRLAKKSIGN